MGRKLQPGVDKIDEAWVKKEIKAILKTFGFLKYDMPGATMYGESGRHDFIICQRGLFWSIEAKAGKNTPTENQIRFALEVEEAKGMSICVNEMNLELLREVASYVDHLWSLPYHLKHDFRTYRK